MTGMPESDDARTTSTSCLASEPPADPSPPQPAPRPRGKPFQAGNRAGLKGRPRTDQRLRAALNRWSLEAARCLRDLMRDAKTPRETKRKIAEYLVDRKLGRPTTSISGADGTTPLFPGASTYSSPIAALLEKVRARSAAAASADRPESPSTTQAENAAPGASGAEPGMPS